MPRQEYQRRLARLRTDVCALAELVLERYELALEARVSDDPSLAERVREGDHDVNDRYLVLESDCIDLLALQQPVAGDLRFIASSFKVLTDLERVGDLATNLAGYGAVADDDLADSLDLHDLAEDAGELVADAVGAYEADDAAAARRVAARDDELDRRCAAASRRVVRELLEADGERHPAADGARSSGGSGVRDVATERDPATDDTRPATPRDPSGSDPVRLEDGEPPLVTDASRALLTIRDVERVGDHAVNVCARTVYAVDGDETLCY